MPEPTEARDLLAAYNAGERDFRRAILDGAILYDATLSGANLSGAILYDATLDGAKTQTRRLRLPGDIEAPGMSGIWRNHKALYQVGKTYAVQPGRGKKAVARIVILRIRSEDVRLISDGDILAEGYDRLGFFLTWTKMHDVPANRELRRFDSPPLRLLDSRPPERYQAWVLTFKVVS